MPRRNRAKLNATLGAAAGSVVCGLLAASPASAQSAGNRILGLDISAHQGIISQTTWDDISNVENRKFVIVRASRGGTTGEDHRQGGYPAGDNTFFNLSQRYDDRFRPYMTAWKPAPALAAVCTIILAVIQGNGMLMALPSSQTATRAPQPWLLNARWEIFFGNVSDHFILPSPKCQRSILEPAVVLAKKMPSGENLRRDGFPTSVSRTQSREPSFTFHTLILERQPLEFPAAASNRPSGESAIASG